MVCNLLAFGMGTSMTLLGFKERFVAPIEARTKKQTIRAGKLRFTVGGSLQLYRRVRQKDMRKIVDDDPICVKTQAIVILRTGGRWLVLIDDAELPDEGVHALASDDGFASTADFFDFFLGRDGGFAGHIIHWDWLP